MLSASLLLPRLPLNSLDLPDGDRSLHVKLDSRLKQKFYLGKLTHYINCFDACDPQAIITFIQLYSLYTRNIHVDIITLTPSDVPTSGSCNYGGCHTHLIWQGSVNIAL